MYKITSRWPHQDSIKIEWNLGKRCNYDCSYCPSSIHDNSSPHTDIAILKATVDKLKMLDKPIRLSFTGGEPTVHPNFSELIEYCRDAGVSWISVTTNGTRTAAWYTKQRVDHYVFSIHFEYDYSKILDTIASVIEVKDKLMVNIMALHNKMNEVRDIVVKCKVWYIPYAIRRIRWTEGDPDLFDDLRYTPEDLDWIKEQEATVQGNCLIDVDTIMHSNDVIKLHMNQYKDWSCNAGLESLMINWDGDVHRATCRVGGSLGNIYNSNFVSPTKPVTCDRNFCTCAADIPITKLKIS